MILKFTPCIVRSKRGHDHTHHSIAHEIVTQYGRAGAWHVSSCPALQCLAVCPTAPAWIPSHAPERLRGLYSVRAGSWWGLQSRCCGPGTVVMLAWCDHPGIAPAESCGAAFHARALWPGGRKGCNAGQVILHRNCQGL